MTTLSDLTADIADDCDDTTGEYGAAILKAVQGAQRDCERSTYYFNETRDVSFVTEAGRAWYTSEDMDLDTLLVEGGGLFLLEDFTPPSISTGVDIAMVIRIQQAYYVNSSIVTALRRATPEELEVLGDTPTGEPSAFTYFSRRIRIYPVPNGVYTIRLQLGPYRLTPLVSPADTNAWLDEAYDLIKARAKYRLYKNTLRDPGLAMEAKGDWLEQDEALQGETTSRHATGFIRPTRF